MNDNVNNTKIIDNLINNINFIDHEITDPGINGFVKKKIKIIQLPNDYNYEELTKKYISKIRDKKQLLILHMILAFQELIINHADRDIEVYCEGSDNLEKLINFYINKDYCSFDLDDNMDIDDYMENFNKKLEFFRDLFKTFVRQDQKIYTRYMNTIEHCVVFYLYRYDNMHFGFYDIPMLKSQVYYIKKNAYSGYYDPISRKRLGNMSESWLVNYLKACYNDIAYFDAWHLCYEGTRSDNNRQLMYVNRDFLKR